MTFVEPDPEVGQEEDPKALISQLFQAWQGPFKRVGFPKIRRPFSEVLVVRSILSWALC